MIEVVLSRFGD